MGKCVQCEDFFAPHFMVEIEGEDIDPLDPPQKCAFCHLDKTEVTIVDDETKQEEKISKKEAAKRYKIFLKRLKETPNIAAVLDKAKGMPNIK